MKKTVLLLMASLILTGSCSASTPRRYVAEVVRTLPHSTGAYTQGLFFDSGRLIESAGQWGESALRELDLETGKALQTKSFKHKYFLEGSVVFGSELYLLTWTNKLVFVHDPKTFEYIRSYSYPREGWGLTTDGKSLIASDGSSHIYFMDKDLRVTRTLNVTLGGRPRPYLNELEYIDGKIWANVYTTDMIVIIDPSSGEVTATVDCSGISKGMKRTERTDVLNGIAYDPAEGKIYLTGKYWPNLYEVKLKEKKQ